MHLLLIDEKGLPLSSGTHYMYNLEINIFGFVKQFYTLPVSVIFKKKKKVFNKQKNLVVDYCICHSMETNSMCVKVTASEKNITVSCYTFASIIRGKTLCH